jgi:hypothetical protein
MADPVEITEVVQRVECEIYDTAIEFRSKKGTEWIENFTAKVTLSLTVSADGSVAPDFSLLGPFIPGTYALGIGGSLKGTAERIATYAFSIDFSREVIKRFHAACRDKKNTRLHGTIGFHDWFSRVIRSHDGDDPFSRPTDLSHKLEFQLDAGFKLTPGYELLRSRGSSPLSTNLTLKHTVDFTMTYNDPPSDEFDKVCVVNMGGPCPKKSQIARAAGRPKGGTQAVQQRLNNNLLDLNIRSLRLDQIRR